MYVILNLTSNKKKSLTYLTHEIVEFSDRSLPNCWSQKQKEMFIVKYDGLMIRNGKLGCNYCSKVNIMQRRGLNVSLQWKHFLVEPSGTGRLSRQSSLRKKMSKHFGSKSHIMCTNIVLNTDGNAN